MKYMLTRSSVCNPPARHKSRLLLSAMAAMMSLATLAGAQVKKAVQTADDLPRHTYDIHGSALATIKDKQAMIALSQEVKADLESDLENYDIKDRSLREAYERALQQIDIINGANDQALARIPSLRDLSEREDDKLMTGFSLKAHLAAIKAATGTDGVLDQAKYTDAFKAALRTLILPLPMDVIHDRLQKGRLAAKMISREMIESGIDQQLNPLIEANPGKVPGEVAGAMISTRFLLDMGLSVAMLSGQVYGEFLDGKVPGAVSVKPAVAADQPDLWTPTLVTLNKDAKATPVVVAVWDSGVDTKQYPDQLWTSPDKAGDGSDIHGIAFGLDHRPTSGDLYPLDALKSDKAECMNFVSASMDMQAGIETPAVEMMRKHVLSLRGKGIEDFQQDMGIIGNYVHGTHVAGIVAAGNPFVRLLCIRETFDYKSIPDEAPTLDSYTRWGNSAQSAVDFARKAHVRVVNMSWRIPREAVEQMLAIKGVGKTTSERAELSRQIFNAFRNRLESAIAGAPDILFVAGAGNEDNDADFNEYIPAGLRLANLLTVGAVDCSGKPTTFTTTAKNITLYANGYQIDSLVPGGQHMKLSGTSMSSPQVANLAAKLFALKPSLTVQEAIGLIRKGATPLADHPGRFIINPAASIKLLHAAGD